MERPPKSLIHIIRLIDPIGIWSGKLVGWLIIPLILGLTYEVIARYVFNAPTVWAFDVSYMLNGSLGMLGAAYTLYKKGHIRTDVFYEGWSPRKKGWVDAISYLFLFFPGILFFLWPDWTWRSIPGASWRRLTQAHGVPLCTRLRRWFPFHFSSSSSRVSQSS